MKQRRRIYYSVAAPKASAYRSGPDFRQVDFVAPHAKNFPAASVAGLATVGSVETD